ncbi:hypothetical protein DFH11DRAFT_1548316 [Phellopilus nigrolimitatus]|nr:hypothetical protein DFH11DRAFT_1548316 [Phellopilus nigrolimitatus]
MPGSGSQDDLLRVRWHGEWGAEKRGGGGAIFPPSANSGQLGIPAHGRFYLNLVGSYKYTVIVPVIYPSVLRPTFYVLSRPHRRRIRRPPLRLSRDQPALIFLDGENRAESVVHFLDMAANEVFNEAASMLSNARNTSLIPRELVDESRKANRLNRQREYLDLRVGLMKRHREIHHGKEGHTYCRPALSPPFPSHGVIKAALAARFAHLAPRHPPVHLIVGYSNHAETRARARAAILSVRPAATKRRLEEDAALQGRARKNVTRPYGTRRCWQFETTASPQMPARREARDSGGSGTAQMRGPPLQRARVLRSGVPSRQTDQVASALCA